MNRGDRVRRTAVAAGVLGTALILPGIPANAAARPLQSYTSSERTCLFGERTDYAPHAYAVCSSSSVNYSATHRSGVVNVSGEGTTEFTFDAGVYHRDYSIEYPFDFVTKSGREGAYHLQETSSYSPAPGVTCTFSIDFLFVNGLLERETASNVCP
jgi:hypothetical protein